MKLKIGWKALGKALWNAVKPVLLGAVGGGVIALTCTQVRSPLYGSTFSLYERTVWGLSHKEPPRQRLSMRSRGTCDPTAKWITSEKKGQTCFLTQNTTRRSCARRAASGQPSS